MPAPSSTTLRWLIGLALALALVLWVHWAVGWPRLLAPWAEMPAGRLALALALVALSYLLRALRIYDYFRADLVGRFAATARLSFLHNAANNLLPMRLGEAAFPLLMQRYFGKGWLASGVSLLWIRLLDLHFVLLVGILALLPPSAWSLLLPLLWLALLPLSLGLRPRLEPALRARAPKLAAALAHVPAQGWLNLRIWLWTAASWTLKVAAFVLVVTHFAELPARTALAGVVGAELSSVLPVHGVAGAGSYEGAMTLALLPLGVSQAAALTAAVNLHLFLLGCTLLLALTGLLLPRPGLHRAGEPPILPRAENR